MRVATGIIRKFDHLNRLVIPREVVRNMRLEGSLMEIFVDSEGEIILRRHQASCSFCGNTEHLLEHKGKMICTECVNILAPFATK